MNNAIKKVKILFSRIVGKLESVTNRRPFVCCLTLGAAMNLLIYLLHARSLTGALSNVFDGFGFFLFNSLILISFFSLSLFFARRIFALFLVFLFWLAMGVTDCVLMSMRNAPLEGIDFYILRTGFNIIFIYMSIPEIVLWAFLILLSLSLIVLLFIKLPKTRPGYTRALLIFLCCLLVLSLVGVIATRDDEAPDADVCGFPYFFLRSIFDRGINRPEDYSEENIRNFLADLAKSETPPPQSTPNIIFVQLESFFDVTRMKRVSFSEDPIPNFRRLAKEYPSGTLEVESIGSGTANTEFEVLSGLDLSFFGTGEYPYESVLSDKCCETAAFLLKDIGYTTHGIHNHTATFYDRFAVYANLGFDTFTAAEHMEGVEYNAIGWEKDAVLTDYVIKALQSSEGKDFVFTVSVQAHGKYPDIPMCEEGGITVFGIEGEERKNAFEFYANELRATDRFIGELWDALNSFGEDFVLVLYGDHLPSLDIVEDELKDSGLYNTDYLIASNIELPLEDANVEAYRLFPALFNALGIQNGLVNKAHASYGGSVFFSDILELLGYDTLYGDQIAYGGIEPYSPTNITLGLEAIRVTFAENGEDGITVGGTGFNSFSQVFLNGRKLETEFLDNNTLFCVGEFLEYGDRVTVVQISSNFRKLSETAPYTYSRGFLD